MMLSIIWGICKMVRRKQLVGGEVVGMRGFIYT
jgi:hypothetical protein